MARAIFSSAKRATWSLARPNVLLSGLKSCTLSVADVDFSRLGGGINKVTGSDNRQDVAHVGVWFDSINIYNKYL